MSALLAPEAVQADTAELLGVLADAAQPTPDMSISAWAAGRVVIPGETGTDRPGPLSWDGFEYLIEPLERLHPDDPCRDVSFLGSAQVAKTTIGVVATLYYSAFTPRPWGVALPSTDEVLKYNRVKWQPIVDETPELKRKIRPVSSRDERGSTNTYKRFAGGSGSFFGAGSPKALQMISLCLVVYEETPNWEREVGGRGDPRAQIRKRQIRWEMAGAKTFHNSTPGTVRPREDGDDGPDWIGCPITEDFEAGDQRRLYHPCPHCGDQSDGVWLRLDYERMLGLVAGETPHFSCPGCGADVEHHHKAEMVRRCVWLPTFVSEREDNPAPGWAIPTADLERWRERPCDGRSPSYHAWQVVSSAVDWAYIAKEHRDAAVGTEAVKMVFAQQILGQAYKLTVQKTDVKLLLDKRDNRLVRGKVPSGFELLTCAIDLNGDWAQWTVYAWGPGSAHTPIDKGRIEGSPSDPTLWAEVSELFRRRYEHEDGGWLELEGRGVDSGYGTFHVYAFCERHAGVLALDGADGWGQMPLRRSKTKQKLRGEDGTVASCRTYRVGTWDLKRELLNDAIPLSLEHEASAIRPAKPVWPGWVEQDFFEELSAEALVATKDRKTGVEKAEAWVRVRRRNEEMDLWVYNCALARSKGVGVPGSEPDWLELARRRTAGQMLLEDLWDRPTPASAPKPAAPPAPVLETAGGWDWRKR
jgi:phage terminase large subunit GpA-like protein